MSTIFAVKGALKTEFLISNSRNEKMLNRKKEIKLLEEITFTLPDSQELTVKPGFVFDGATIPQICWTTIGHPLEHRFIYAALLHDALYASRYLPRKEADRYFLQFLKEFSGVGKYTAGKMYLGVRLFGEKAWNEKTDDQIAEAAKLVELKGSKQ